MKLGGHGNYGKKQGLVLLVVLCQQLQSPSQVSSIGMVKHVTRESFLGLSARMTISEENLRRESAPRVVVVLQER